MRLYNLQTKTFESFWDIVIATIISFVSEISRDEFRSCRSYKVELFAKMVNGFNAVTHFSGSCCLIRTPLNKPMELCSLGKKEEKL